MRVRRSRKWLTATFALLLGLPLLAEGALRAWYYQGHGPETFALVHAYRSGEARANRLLARMQGRQDPEAMEAGAPVDPTLVFGAEGAAVLPELEARYAGDLAALAADLHRDGVKLVVVHLPNLPSEQPAALAAFVPFVRALCGQFGADFIDMRTAALAGHPDDRVRLLPDDGHLSRYGHRLVADALAPTLTRLAPHRARASYPPKARPARFGDLAPDLDEVRSSDFRPFRLVTNAQGLRMDHDLAFPKTRQRVMFLGDSITFAAHVNLEDSFPGFLQARFPDREFVDAGFRSYTLADQLSMWRERARFAEPDIVVLQTHANDVTDYLAGHMNVHARDRRIHAPSEAERRFLEVARATPAAP